MPIVFQGQRSRSYCHIVGKRCRQDTEWTVNSRIIQLGKIDHHDERKVPIGFFFKVGGQRSRPYIVGKRDRIRCIQDTNWTESSRICTIYHPDKRKMPIVIQGQSSRSLYHLEMPLSRSSLTQTEPSRLKPSILFRSPESLRWPMAMGWRPSSSVVRRPLTSSRTTWPILTKFGTWV